MSPMPPVPLVHITGFFLGAVLFGLLLVMALGGGAPFSLRAWRHRLHSPAPRLLALTGFLGLLWNLGGFLAYGLQPSAAPSGAPNGASVSPELLMVAFVALAFLPAVVVHSVVTRGTPTPPAAGRRLILAAYGVSTLASLLDVDAALRYDEVHSQTAITTLTVGFAVVVAWLLASARRSPNSGQPLGAAAIALFAVSALHLAHHTGSERWWVEVIGHHASLVLALAVLHREYRFALADLFLKRALAVTLILAAVLSVHLLIGARWLGAHTAAGTSGAFATTYVLILALVTLAAARVVGPRAAWFVDHVVLRRPDYDGLKIELAAAIAPETNIERLLTVAARQLSDTFEATVDLGTLEREPERLGARILTGADAEAVHRAARPPVERSGDLARHDTPQAPHAALVVPTVEAPCFVLLLGELGGGRRLFSDDLALLDSVAFLLGRRIDALRVAEERYVADLREQQVRRLATEAELRALRAQLNPHFLFNALTTIGALIATDPARALTTLLRLTSLLRGVLRRVRTEFVALEEELELVESYLDIEKARFEERLKVVIDVPDTLRSLRVPSLLLQPLVENAVKHGIAQRAEGGEVAVIGRAVDGRFVRLIVRDTGAGAAETELTHGRARGLGLASVEQRLHGHFGSQASLRVTSTPEMGTTAEVELPMVPPSAASRAHAPSLEVRG